MLVDQRSEGVPRRYSFFFEGGVVSYISFLNRGQKVVHSNPFYVNQEEEDMRVEVAFQYTNEINSHELAFANNILNPEGGSHIAGFRTALTRSLNNYARKQNILKEKDINLSGEDVREGLTAVVSIKIHEPQFEGVIFSDGRVAIRWLTACRSTSTWDDFDTMLAVHGHPEERYASHIVFHECDALNTIGPSSGTSKSR